MNRPLSLVFAASLAASLAAQNPPAPKPPAQDPPASTGEPSPAPGGETDGRVNERAQSMREQIESGRQVKSHVRVSVRLKNGNKLTGIVKDGRFVERVDGLRFVDANAQEKGAGIRLWYSGGTRNYVFVPFAQFSEYQVLARLSTKQLEDIEKEMQMDEARRAAEKARQEPPKPAPTSADPAAATEPAAGTEPAPTKPAAGDAQGAVSAEDQQRKAYLDLITSYPPKAGWGPKKRDEISHRLVVLGTAPSATEKAFVEKFADWQKAVAYFGLDAEVDKPAGDKPAGDKSGGEEQDGGSKRRNRRR